jgi:hypothetical protein
MNAPVDHHFIPAFYLSQWAGQNGKLFEYTIKRHKLIAKPVGPKSTGYESHLYSFPELPPDTAQFIEDEFFRYADQTAYLALEIHLGRSSRPWTSELLSAWSRFVIAIHLRHPDAMPELRAGAVSIWNGSGDAYQAEYEHIRTPADPPTFDERIMLIDPLIPIKARVNMVIKSFDNEIVGAHINQMKWATVDLSASPDKLLLSDRPVEFFRLKEPNGVASIPISPTKLFVAVNDPAFLVKLRQSKPRALVHSINKNVVSRARRFVWAADESSHRFIANHMSKNMEPTPLFPNVGLVTLPARHDLIDESIRT